MKKPGQDTRDVQAQLSRRVRLQALLFSGAVLGTSLLMFWGPEGKLPRSQGE